MGFDVAVDVVDVADERFVVVGADAVDDRDVEVCTFGELLDDRLVDGAYQAGFGAPPAESVSVAGSTFTTWGAGLSLIERCLSHRFGDMGAGFAAAGKVVVPFVDT